MTNPTVTRATDARAATPLVARSGHRLSFGRRLALILAFVGTLAGVTAASTTPAAAAPAGSATVCFQGSWNSGYQTYWGPLGWRAFKVDVYLNGQWHELATMETLRNGCSTVNGLAAGHHYRFRMDFYNAGRRNLGISGWQTIRAGYHHNFGTVRVYTL